MMSATPTDCLERCSMTLGCANASVTDSECLYERGPRPICKRNCSLPWDTEARHDADDVPWLGSAYHDESEARVTSHQHAIAVCMAGQPRTIVHPHVWRRHVQTLHNYAIFLVLSTHHTVSYASALSAALHAIRPKRVRFLARSFQPVCGDNTMSIQLHYLAECHHVVPLHYTAIVRTRPDHVWHVTPNFEASIAGLKNTMVTRNDWAVVADRHVFRKWSSVPLECHRVCAAPPRLWSPAMSANNEYCAFVAHLARIDAGHMECTHPGERELFLRRAPESRCTDLKSGQIVRWSTEKTKGPDSPDAPLVCEVGTFKCRLMTREEILRGSVDVHFDTEMPEMKAGLDDPWAHVT